MNSINHANTPINQSTSKQSISVQDFAFRIKRELNFATTTLTDAQTHRLSEIRRLALQRQKAPQTRFAMRLIGAHHGSANHSNNLDADGTNWLKLFTSIIPIALIIFALFFANEWQAIDRVDELSDIDTQLLTDDLPFEAYLDHGFKVFLEHDDVFTDDAERIDQ